MVYEKASSRATDEIRLFGMYLAHRIKAYNLAMDLSEEIQLLVRFWKKKNSAMGANLFSNGDELICAGRNDDKVPDRDTPLWFTHRSRSTPPNWFAPIHWGNKTYNVWYQFPQKYWQSTCASKGVLFKSPSGCECFKEMIARAKNNLLL